LVSRPFVVIPTYNEIDNIKLLIPSIFEQDERLSVLVVDDSSPDGTGDFAQQLAVEDSRVSVIIQPDKGGLGRAYRTGITEALELGADVVIQMDADLSHPPELLPQMLREIEFSDLVIASRYLNGVAVVNWSIQRLLLSCLGNIYARWVTGVGITDFTGGYRCTRRRLLEMCGFEKTKSIGYAFQIELNYRLIKCGANMKEIGFVYIERSSGVSKLGSGTVREALWVPWWLRIASALKIL
jgi:dolichol-phosphate mannosyltransferase